MLDTCVIIDLEVLATADLPLDGKISTVSVSELMIGVHIAKTPVEHSIRVTRLMSVGVNFVDPLPFDERAMNVFNTLAALTVAIGRNPKPRKNGLMIAATAVANGLPLYTANAEDFEGLESMLEVIGVQAA